MNRKAAFVITCCACWSFEATNAEDPKAAADAMLVHKAQCEPAQKRPDNRPRAVTHDHDAAAP